MDDARIAETYEAFVVAPELERLALLEALCGLCGSDANVLYPGSSVHVTPSFFFQHVVYVDQSELCQSFFARAEAVRVWASARKRYRQQPYVRFIAQDFTTALPLLDASFDLLLALYAGGISRACARYLKPGGFLLSNDHHGDAHDAAAIPGLALHAVLEERRGKIRTVGDDQGRLVPGSRPVRPRPRAKGLTAYYLFRKNNRTP